MKQRDPKFTVLAIVVILAVIYLLIATKRSKHSASESNSQSDENISYDAK